MCNFDRYCLTALTEIVPTYSPTGTYESGCVPKPWLGRRVAKPLDRSKLQHKVVFETVECCHSVNIWIFKIQSSSAIVTLLVGFQTSEYFSEKPKDRELSDWL